MGQRAVAATSELPIPSHTRPINTHGFLHLTRPRPGRSTRAPHILTAVSSSSATSPIAFGIGVVASCVPLRPAARAIRSFRAKTSYTADAFRAAGLAHQSCRESLPISRGACSKLRLAGGGAVRLPIGRSSHHHRSWKRASRRRSRVGFRVVREPGGLFPFLALFRPARRATIGEDALLSAGSPGTLLALLSPTS